MCAAVQFYCQEDDTCALDSDPASCGWRLGDQMTIALVVVVIVIVIGAGAFGIHYYMKKKSAKAREAAAEKAAAPRSRKVYTPEDSTAWESA